MATRSTFLRNVVWGWVGVGVNIVIGILLAPIIIRKLGVAQYGLWVLLFSLLDYMRVLDFGFRAAVVNGCARYRAREDWAGVNRTVVSALGYFLAITAACLLLAVGFRGLLIESVEVSEPFRPIAHTLIVLIAVTLSLRLVSSPLTATLEAFQRFDVVNRAYIGSLVFRAAASIAVLYAGYGLVAMAWVVLMAQAGESLFTLVRVRQLVPQLTLSPSLISRDALVALFRYGRYSALISAANLVSINAPATVLGYLRSAAEVAYFALPFRLLMYSAEGLAKVADVTSSLTASLDEGGDRRRVWRLAVLTNRQCFALFMPLAIFLSFYGTALLRVWVTPEVAENSGALLPVIALAYLFAISGQYNAGAVLIGQARHAWYAYGAVVEAVATIVFLLLFVPAHGALAAAWVVTTIMLVVRGAYLAAALCFQNGYPFGEYLWAVYGRGLLTAIPVVLLAVTLRETVWQGDTWAELILAGGTIAATYYGAALFSVVESEHRQQIFQRVRSAVS